MNFQTLKSCSYTNKVVRYKLSIDCICTLLRKKKEKEKKKEKKEEEYCLLPI